MDTTVTKQTDPDRFEITVDGQTAGFVRFVDVGGQRVLYHTEIFEEHSGQGLGGTLVQDALEATRTEGLRIVPVCPFVKKHVSKHDEWAEAVDPVTPAALEAIPAK